MSNVRNDVCGLIGIFSKCTSRLKLGFRPFAAGRPVTKMLEVYFPRAVIHQRPQVVSRTSRCGHLVVRHSSKIAVDQICMNRPPPPPHRRSVMGESEVEENTRPPRSIGVSAQSLDMAKTLM